MNTLSMGKIQRTINANLETQRRNAPDTAQATAARQENAALFQECERRGYAYQDIGGFLMLFKSQADYHAITNTKPEKSASQGK